MRRLRSNLLSMLKQSRFQTIGTIILIACLIVLTVILGGVMRLTDNAVASVEDRLGFYFYLEESIDEAVGASALLQLTQDLELIGLEPVYYSKEHSFERLARSLPDVMDELEEYGIGNPLPPTLYVPFTSRESYELLRAIVVEYELFITNSGELDSQVVFGEQEQRVQSIISVSQNIQYLVVGLLISLVVVMWAFVAYGNQTNLMQFRQQLGLEKLLWASWVQRVIPFFGWTWLVVGWSSLIARVTMIYLVSLFETLLTHSSDSAFQTVLVGVDFTWLLLESAILVLIVGTMVTGVMMMRER